jgi:hypothetical protein
MRGKRFIPERNKIYQNVGGGKFICLESNDFCDAVMQNIASKWTFTAKVCRIYSDGKIDWDYSTGGYFA